MVRVIQEVEPTCFEQAVGNPKWDNANWSGESIHANTTKATFGISETHTKVPKTYFIVWNFLRSQELVTSTWIHGC
jgi:hypothetical protein